MSSALQKLLLLSCIAASARSGFASQGAADGERWAEFSVGGHKLAYGQVVDSVPGKFLFALYAALPVYKREKRTTTSLGVLDSSGTVAFQRTFESRFEPMIIGDFKPVEPGLYAYLLGAEEGLQWSSTCHFLDKDFREVFPRDVPNDDPDLDMHDVQRMRNGDYLFLLYRDRIQDAVIDAEIQERDRRGKKVFAWNSKGRLAPPPDAASTMDYLHVNSVEQDRDGGLLVSLAETSEIAKLSFPEGKVLWRMSYRNWKFLNDPLQGFRHQHSVRRLANGNLLLFDNGGHGREEISRAVEYKINETAKTATLVWEYREKPGNPFRETGGSAQRLANGNTLIGWGGVSDHYTFPPGRRLPLFTEVDSAGKTVRELLSQDDEVSYRVSFEAIGQEAGQESPGRER